MKHGKLIEATSELLAHYHTQPDDFAYEHLHNGNCRTKSWHELGLPRTRGDTVSVEDEQSEQDHGKYPNILQRGNGTWYFQFEIDKQRHVRGGFASALAAAYAHDNYVRNMGIDKPLIFDEREGAA